MKIGVDFDGTIADTNAEKSRWIENNLGLKIPSYQCDKTSCLTIIGEKYYRKMGKEIYSTKITTTLAPIENSLKTLELLKKKAIIYIITARNGWRLNDAKDWLSKYRETEDLQVIEYEKSTQNKIELCKDNSITVLIDDDERHFPLNSSKILPILFKYKAPIKMQICNSPIKVCTHWENVYKEIINFIGDRC